MKILNTVSLCLLLTNLGCATPIERVIKATDPKVVKIGLMGEKEEGACSGAIISPAGMVLTCAHCFAHSGLKKVFIKTNTGKAYRAVLVEFDRKKDLALIAPVASLEKFSYFRFGPRPVKGQQVLAFGSPEYLRGTDSVGYVENFLEDGYFIIHSAFINPGSSGGPLVNLKGELIGVNEGIMMDNPFTPAQGLFIAIDMRTVQAFLEGK